MNRVRAGFFSMAGAAVGDGYLRWHQLDHMPEQYQIDGFLHGQRFISTPECDAARAHAVGDLASTRSLQMYLFTEPVKQALDDFAALGRRLDELGRYPEKVPSILLGAFHLLETHAAPRVLISGDVVPWRPNRGVYAIVERPTAEGAEADVGGWVQWTHREHLPALLGVDGVVGAWAFATSNLYKSPGWTPGSHRITIVWLDDEPTAVAASMRPLLDERWSGAPMEPILAAPFVSLTEWHL